MWEHFYEVKSFAGAATQTGSESFIRVNLMQGFTVFSIIIKTIGIHLPMLTGPLIIISARLCSHNQAEVTEIWFVCLNVTQVWCFQDRVKTNLIFLKSTKSLWHVVLDRIYIRSVAMWQERDQSDGNPCGLLPKCTSGVFFFF